MDIDSRVYVAGHTGMIGSAIVRLLREKGYLHLILKTHEELDLRNIHMTDELFSHEKPEYVFLVAAKMASITAIKNEPTEYFYDNSMIALNVIHAAIKYGVKRLIFISSSWVYPQNARQPLREEDILTERFHEAYESYALSKLCGMKYCEFASKQYKKDFFSIISTNVYGVGDNYDMARSHVIPGMIRRFHEAKMSGASKVLCWGNGMPIRDFMYSDDMADLCLFLMENGSLGNPMINVASGRQCSIKELADIIAAIVGYKGEIAWDETKPSGAPKLLFDCTLLARMGWKSSVELEEGICRSYKDFVDNWSKR